MKRLLIALGIVLLVVVGFGLGYSLHLTTEIRRFAKETDRSTDDYELSLVWIKPPGADWSRPAVLAQPLPGFPIPRQVETRWRWAVPNPSERCDPEEHRLIWRVGNDAWELVDDLDQDRSLPLFPEEDEGR